MKKHTLSGNGSFHAANPGGDEQDYCDRCGYSLIYILAFKQRCDKDRRCLRSRKEGAK